MKLSTLAAAFALAAGSTVMAATGTATAAKGVPSPSSLPAVGALRSQGCWAAMGATWKKSPLLKFPSSGSCGGYCTPLNYTVAALHANICYCGNDYPPQKSTSSDKNCNYPCPGYDPEACGGLTLPGYYSVFNTGVELDVPFAPDSSSTSSSAGTSATDPSETLIVTETGTSAPDPATKSGGGPNTVGIAVGVVVGVVLLAGAIGAGYFYVRKKKRQEQEEERRRADAVNAFVGNGKAGSVSGSFADSRLDPVMAHRRMSDGSIADNEDYSRKILRVTNA